MLGWLDDFVVDRVAQPICDRFADRVTAPALAAQCFSGSAVMGAGYLYGLYADGRLGPDDIVFGAINLAAMSWMADREATKKPDRSMGAMPADRARFAWLRRFVFLLAILATLLPIASVWVGGFSVTGFLSTLGVWLEAAGFAFAACRRNPPKPRRQEARIGDALPSPAA